MVEVDPHAAPLGPYVKPKKTATRMCGRCHQVKEHTPAGIYCRECWSKYEPLKKAQRRYEAKFTRPRIDGKKVRVPKN